MKKISYYLLTIVILALFLFAIVLVYAYSSGGNARIANYLEKRLQKQTGLPIKFDKFELGRKELYFIAVIGKEASLGFDGTYSLLHQSISGKYLLRTVDFKYKKYTLRQANISGNVSGTINDIVLSGKGTLLDGPVSFKLNIKDRNPQDIVVQFRNLPLDEILALSGNPKILRGGLDADILMPSLGKDGSKGSAVVQIKNAHFDQVLVRKLYNYTLPSDKTSLKGEFKADLDGQRGTFEGKIISDLITATVKNGQADLSQKAAACDISLDAKELSLLTQNKLKGPLKLAGEVKYDTLGLRAKAKTNSLGGNIDIDYTKAVSLKLINVSLSKILHITGQPDLAEGNINGRLMLDGPNALNGSYTLSITQGKLHTKIINQQYGTSLPPNASISLVSKGKITDGKLNGSSKIASNLFSITAPKTIYETKSGRFVADYLIIIPNPLLLAGKNGKGVPVLVSGKIAKDKVLQIKGNAKGLGKRLDFVYTGDKLKLIGSGIRIERILASAGQPISLTGTMDIKADFDHLRPLEGSFSVLSSSLKTDPTEIKKLTGKPMDTTLSIKFSGKAKKGILFANGDIRSSLINIALPKIVYSTVSSSISSPYSFDIPDLAKFKSLIDTDLQGKFASEGEFRKDKILNIKGSSSSLGGKLTYSYIGDQADIRMQGVELPKILHMLKQPEQLLGETDANIRYNTSNKKGTAHLSINKFQFKPGKLTTAVKMLLQKDLSQVIYDRTVVDAIINGDKIAYKISARGKRSDFVIKDGLFDTKAKTNKGSFGLRIDNLDVIGTIKGPVKRPKVSVLPGKMLRSKLKKKMVDKVKKEVEKNAGSTVKKIIKKIPLF